MENEPSKTTLLAILIIFYLEFIYMALSTSLRFMEDNLPCLNCVFYFLLTFIISEIN